MSVQSDGDKFIPVAESDVPLSVASLSLAAYLTAAIIEDSSLAAVLQDLLSVRELLDINNRIEIIRRLEQGQAQRKVAQDLGVGIATVNRGAKIVQAKQRGC